MRLNDNRLKVEICARIGMTEIPLRHLLHLSVGDTIPFSGQPGAPIDILANRLLIGKGCVTANAKQKIEITLTEKL